MKQERKVLIILFLCSLWTFSLQGQETIPTTGGVATGSGGSVTFTVGQVTYHTFTGINGTVAQGVQQPYEISVVTAIENTQDINLECTVYPNPTRSIIKLSIESLDFENMRFQLFDINGILIQGKKVESKETEISMDYLIPSIYFLKVIKDKKEVKTFKIIKN